MDSAARVGSVQRLGRSQVVITGMVEFWTPEQIGADGTRTGFWGKIRADDDASRPVFFHGSQVDHPELIQAGTLVSYCVGTDPIKGPRARHVKVLGDAEGQSYKTFEHYERRDAVS
jgi:cold shock CspA family protein